MTADKIEMIAAEVRYTHPALGDALARLVQDVRRMQRTLDEVVREAQEDEEMSAGRMVARMAGLADGSVVALVHLRRGPLGMRA